jgi:hypothetical protein
MNDGLKAIGVLCVAVLALVAAECHARVWYVRQDGGGDAPTIQAAIDSAAANDTVLVAPGTYAEPEIHVLKDSLTIMGDDGAPNTILHTSGSLVMWTYGACLTIKGFCFESSPGVVLSVTEMLANNGTVIEENIFRNNGGGWAIDVRSIFPEKTVGASANENIIIRNNLIYSNSGGILIGQWTGGVEIYQNTISHNAPGIAIDNEEMLCHNTIHHNIISYNGIGVSGFEYCVSNFLCNDIFGNKNDFGAPPVGTNGNISADPQFCGVDPAQSGNFFLQSDSPCAPGNHPDGYACGQIGVRPVGCEDVSVQRSSWGAIKAIYR